MTSSLSRGTFRVIRAIRISTFGGPEVLQLHSEIPVPEPSETEVQIKVHAAGVNPVETYIRTGLHAVRPTLPFTPGTDAAGIVEKVGSKVTRFKPGDRVFVLESSSGTYAEYAIAQETSAFHLPTEIDFQGGASLGIPYFSAHRALIHKCSIKSGRTVLIHGASGAVGNACIQIARGQGLKVIGTAGSQEGLDLISKLGAHHVFNHREEGYEQKIMECTSGQGVDYIMEMLANVNLEKDLTLLKKSGSVAVIGCRGPIEINPRALMIKETSVIGVMIRNITKDEMDEGAAYLCAGIEAKYIKPIIAKEYSLDQASQAHIDIINTSSAQGKLLLIP